MAIKLGNIPSGKRVTGTATRGSVSRAFDIAAWKVPPQANAIATNEMRPYRIAPPAGAVKSVSVTAQPAHGRAVVNADNSVTVVPPRGAVGADRLTIRTTFSDATPDAVTTYDVTIGQGTTRGGFAQGLSIPFFKTDADGTFFVERPDNPREIFISKALGKTRAQIAAERGLTAGDITYAWLKANGDTHGYGLSEAQALHPEVGGMRWAASLYFGDTSGRKAPTLRFRAGETYSETDGAYFTDGSGGTPMAFPKGSRAPHVRRPILVTRYGSGEDPILGFRLASATDNVQWVMLKNVTVDGGTALNHGYGVIFDSLKTHGEMNAGRWGGIIYNRIRFWDCFKTVPASGTTWNVPSDHADSNTGCYVDGGSLTASPGTSSGYGYASGVGFVRSSFDAVNLNPTFDPTKTTYPETSKPPTQKGHGVYFNAAIRDAVVLDSMFSRIGLTALWSRNGTSVVSASFASNNHAVIAAMGNYSDFNGFGEAEQDWNGCIEVSASVVITESGGWGSAVPGVGRANMGWAGYDVNGATMTNFAILNGAEPGDTAEYNRKAAWGDTFALTTRTNRPGVKFGNDWLNIAEDIYGGSEIVVWNWYPDKEIYIMSNDRNPYSVSKATLDSATIMKWVDNARGTTGSKRDDFINLLRDSDRPVEDHLDSLLNWFLTRAGYSYPTRTTPQTVVFKPDMLTDGMSWMYRENWIGGDRPGGAPGREIAGDSADLAGHDTIFSLMSLGLVNLNLREGDLTVASGWLGSTGTTSCNSGSVKVGFTGWFEVEDCSDALAVHVEGLGIKWLFANSRVDETTEDIQGHGRFSVTGMVSALDLTVDWGECVIKEGAAVTTTALTLTRRGGELVSGRAHTEKGMGGKVLFDGKSGGAASLMLGGTTRIVADDAALPTISEGRSGEYTGAANVASTLTLGGNLVIDLTAHRGDLNQTLFRADTVAGSFASVTATGLGSRDLTLSVGGNSVVARVASGTGKITVA